MILRNPNQDLFEKEILRMQEEIFHKRLKERMWKIEGIFSEAKNMHGLSRAKYRGLQKMQIQAHMTSAAQNLKRPAIRDIKGEYGIMGVLKNTFRREKVISAKEIIVC